MKKSLPKVGNKIKNGWLFLKKKWKKITFALVVLVLILLLTPILAFNYYSTWGRVFKPLLKSIPYPMVRVGDAEKNYITSKEILTNVEAVRNFYSVQNFEEIGLRVDFKTDQGKQRLEIRELDVLNRITENRLIEIIAKKRGYEVTNEDMEAFLVDKLGDPEKDRTFFLNIRSLYGWSREDFKRIVVKYEVYKNKLIEDFSQELRAGESYQKIQQYAKELEENPAKFDEFAKNYSSGETAQEGGEVGWFSENQILKGLKNSVKEMKKGSISSVLISELGYHILRIDDVREVALEDGGAGTRKEYKLSQIFIGDDNFVTWLKKQKQQIPVKVYARKYQWDNDSAKLIFRDLEMRALMLKLKTQSSGDPSIN